MNLKHLIRVLMAVAVLGSASAGAQTTMPPPTTTPPTSAPPTTAPPTTTPPTTTAPSTTASFQGSTAVFSSTDSNGNPWVVTYDSTNGLLLGASLVNAPSDYSGSVTTTVESDGDDNVWAFSSDTKTGAPLGFNLVSLSSDEGDPPQGLPPVLAAIPPEPTIINMQQWLARQAALQQLQNLPPDAVDLLLQENPNILRPPLQIYEPPPTPTTTPFLPTTLGGASVCAGAIVVIVSAGGVIYYEVQCYNVGQMLMPNPNLTTTTYSGNTYSDDLYSPTPWLDNYWYYSPLNPANWPKLPGF
jgi:hypothetical protein